MDTFTFIVSIILVMLLIQANQTWLVFGIIAMLFVTMRDLGTILLFLASTFVFFIIKQGELNAFWPLIVFGFIILGGLLGLIKGKSQEESYSPGAGYGGLFG